jgi:hypothetical protein
MSSSSTAVPVICLPAPASSTPVCSKHNTTSLDYVLCRLIVSAYRLYMHNLWFGSCGLARAIWYCRQTGEQHSPEGAALAA